MNTINVPALLETVWTGTETQHDQAHPQWLGARVMPSLLPRLYSLPQLLQEFSTWPLLDTSSPAQGTYDVPGLILLVAQATATAQYAQFTSAIGSS